MDRGEAAMRLVHAVRELDRERGLGLETVVLHADADRDSGVVREADDAVAIGPATSMDDRRLERALMEAAPRRPRINAARLGTSAACVGWGW